MNIFSDYTGWEPQTDNLKAIPTLDFYVPVNSKHRPVLINLDIVLSKATTKHSTWQPGWITMV